MSVQLWKVLLPALGLSLLWTACKKNESATVEKNNDTEANVKFSGVAPDDLTKLAKVPVMMSSEFYRQLQSGARRAPKTSTPTDTTTTTVPKDTTTTTVIPPAPLAASYILTAPTPGNQGNEGSCVSWTAASARSIEQYYRTNAASYSYATNIFSPEFIFNQIQVGDCAASGMGEAMNLLVSKGVCTWQTMPYSTYNGCSVMPTSSQYAEAVNYKIASFSVIYSSDVTAIKSAIAAKHPLSTTAVIDNNFYNAGPGYIWNTKGTLVGTHAFTVMGYDDTKHAFRIMNSWGTSWGDGGFLWIDYSTFATICNVLYVMN
jgi:C1A family cysteine protease